jgi:hypothetical protein
MAAPATAAISASYSPGRRTCILKSIFFSRIRFINPKLRPLALPCSAVPASGQSRAAKGEMGKETKLWGGRFEEGVHEAVERFTESVSFEAEELCMHDIRGSIAHAKMLAAQVFISWLIIELLEQQKQ